MDVNDWLQTRTFHHSQYSDKSRLIELKQKKGLTISLGFPTLNEEKSIAKEILAIKGELQDRYPLLDEIAIIDSDSRDNTREVARECGATVYIASHYLKKYGDNKGKGENLWKSLHLLSGDIIVWIDADISNIHPKFVYGVVGPLLENDRIGYVKAFYVRPIAKAEKLKETGGGRVTEIMVRPLISTLYPDIAAFLQPLSGEYAGRREILENVPFRTGYGVEIGLLIDIYNKYGLECLAQVDLDKRVHRNQSTTALGRMSFAILHTVISKAVRDKKLSVSSKLYKEFTHIRGDKERYYLKKEVFPFLERPPIITIPEYRKKRHRV